MDASHYIFIDFENVCVTDLSRVAGRNARVFLIVGSGQERLPIALTLFLQDHPGQLRIIRTPVEGRNALDFILTLEIGRLVEKDPGGRFHIVSRDKGYESIILHLKAEHRHVSRHKSLAEIPALGTPTEPTPHAAPKDRIAEFCRNLRNAALKNRPTTRRKLENHIKSFFGNQTEPEFVGKAIDRLVREKILTFTTTGRIHYVQAA